MQPTATAETERQPDPKAQLTEQYRKIGPAALVAALLCVRKDMKDDRPAASAALGKAA